MEDSDFDVGTLDHVADVGVPPTSDSHSLAASEAVPRSQGPQL